MWVLALKNTSSLAVQTEITQRSACKLKHTNRISIGTLKSRGPWRVHEALHLHPGLLGAGAVDAQRAAADLEAVKVVDRRAGLESEKSQQVKMGVTTSKFKLKIKEK